MAKISQTSAFKICPESSCDGTKPSSTSGNIECKKSDNCGGKGCYCQLFHRDKDAKEDAPWDVTPTDGVHEAKEKTGFAYTCFCVSPILPSGYTICDVPLCKLTETETAGSPTTVECTGDCADPCKCNLFRLDVRATKAEDKATAKWEFVGKAGTKHRRRRGYYYRCFCTK